MLRIHQGGGPISNKKQQKAVRRVRGAFDPDALTRICTQTDFSQYAVRYEVDGPDKDRFFYFKDNGSKVLAVAHLDSVHPDGTAKIVRTAAGLVVHSGTLDDRLGAYVILEMLPRLGINVDWLLTTDEEIGQSTAADFAGPKYEDGSYKQYNHIIQFDRGGTDVVMYEYETKELAGMVREVGAQVGIGSFSDICYLEHMGCKAINWGVGYRDYHGPRAHAYLEDTFMMVARYVRFHERHAETLLSHTYKPKYTTYSYDKDGYKNYSTWDKNGRRKWETSAWDDMDWPAKVEYGEKWAKSHQEITDWEDDPDRDTPPADYIGDDPISNANAAALVPFGEDDDDNIIRVFPDKDVPDEDLADAFGVSPEEFDEDHAVVTRALRRTVQRAWKAVEAKS